MLATGSLIGLPRAKYHYDNSLHFGFGKVSDLERTLGSLGGKLGATMSIGKTTGFLYTLACLLGDANAVKKGKVGKRIARRAAGKAMGCSLGKLFK